MPKHTFPVQDCHHLERCPVQCLRMDKLAETCDIEQKCYRLCDERLIASSKTSTGHKLLHVGAGSGIWALEMAETLGDGATIDALDPCLAQPDKPQANVFFHQAQLDGPWRLDGNLYDLIRITPRPGLIRDPDGVLGQAHRHLKQGGSIEWIEMSWLPRADDGTLPPDSSMVKLCRQFRLATAADPEPEPEPGAPPQRVGGATARGLRAAGFVRVRGEVVRWPTNPWPEIRRNADMGEFSRFSNIYLDHVFRHVMKPTLLLRGLPQGEVDDLVDRAVNELCSIKIHAFFNMVMITGQKGQTDLPRL